MPFVIARVVNCDMGDITTVVAERLQMGQGDIHEAIVFEKFVGGQGDVDILHCLSSTDIETDQGDIGETVIHSEEELVALARKLAKV